jgi:hypothetical protein
LAPANAHIFEDHLLKAGAMVPVVRNINEEVWPSLLLVTCLSILVLVKMRAFPKVLRIIQSTFSNQILQQLEREEINVFRFYAVGLNLLFVFNLSFLIYKINIHYQLVLETTSHLVQYLFFLTIVFGLLILKNLVNWLLAVSTGQRRAISDYLVNSTLVNQTFGIFLFPCVILMEFSPFDPLIFIWPGIVIVLTGIVLKWYRGLIMGLVEERIGLLQIFSYFCGLEILPVFVLVKYIIETF